jgi:hypothetical protein
MGTRGYFAYRYKSRFLVQRGLPTNLIVIGRYYVQFMNSDAYPSWHGERFARSIPRDAKEREGMNNLDIKLEISQVLDP